MSGPCQNPGCFMPNSTCLTNLRFAQTFGIGLHPTSVEGLITILSCLDIFKSFYTSFQI